MRVCVMERERERERERWAERHVFVEKQINSKKIEPVIVVNSIPGLIVAASACKCVCVCVCVSVCVCEEKERECGVER